jgi:hypothetical protein
MSRRILSPRAPVGVLALLVLAAGGCSVRQYTINQLGDALARSSGGTFASDDDPELVKAAAPFSLKLMESLLAENPRNAELLQAAASGFTAYASPPPRRCTGGRSASTCAPAITGCAASKCATRGSARR